MAGDKVQYFEALYEKRIDYREEFMRDRDRVGGGSFHTQVLRWLDEKGFYRIGGSSWIRRTDTFIRQSDASCCVLQPDEEKGVFRVIIATPLNNLFLHLHSEFSDRFSIKRTSCGRSN